MDILLAIANFLVNEILAVPAFLIGIITAVGLGAMGRGAGKTIGGAIKATLGFLLIGAGAGLVSDSLEPLGAMITGATGAQEWCRLMKPLSVSPKIASAAKSPGS